MRYIYFFVLLLAATPSCNSSRSGNPKVEIQTKYGDIVVELYPQQAPKSTAAFLSYIDSGFYKNSTFYRVLKNENQPSNAPKAELIQGGAWKTMYKRTRNLPGTPHESTRETKLRHTNGVVSLARQEAGTATTEFFIVIGDQPGLDYGGNNNADKLGYAAFGKVIEGMDVVHKIHRQPDYEQIFDPLVKIYDIIKL